MVAAPDDQRISRTAAFAGEHVHIHRQIDDLLNGEELLRVPVHDLNTGLADVDAVSDLHTFFTGRFARVGFTPTTEDAAVEEQTFEGLVSRNAFALAAGVVLG